MLTPELKTLANQINATIDVPGIPESVEQWAIEALLDLGLSFLPPPYVAWLKSAADGIDDSEAQAVTEWLAGLMAKHSHYPAFACNFVAGVIVDLLRRGAALVIHPDPAST